MAGTTFLDQLYSGVESTGDPRAQNPVSTASGLYQILDPTWRALGGSGHAKDAAPDEQQARAAVLRAQNERALKAAGLPINDETQYIAWNQGAGGGPALLKNPEGNAVEVLMAAGVPQRQAVQSVLNNGGTMDMTAGAFTKSLAGRMDRGGRMAGTQAADSGTAGGLDLSSAPNVMAQLNAAAMKDPAMQQYVEMQKKLAADNAAYKASLDRQQGELQGFQDRLTANETSGKPPHPPTLPTDDQSFRERELAKVSNRPNDPTRVLGQFLPMLAILGGAFTKGGAIGSLKAATAAMTAAKQNDKDALERAHQDFMDTTSNMLKQYQMEQDEFNDIIASNGNNRANIAAEVSVAAAKYGIPLLKVQADMGDLDGITKFIQARSASIEPMTKLMAAHQAEQDRISAKSQMFQDTDGTPYVYNMRTHEATTLNGDAYTPKGAAHIQSGRPQSMASAVMQQYMREHPNATADELSQEAMRYGARTAAGKAFATGKQGDTIRSLNVSVSHLQTLRELGHALENGDVTAINAAKQRFAEEFGVPAPTNFDAAKSIVADEVAKGVIGGQSAQSDRETLAASLRRSGSPQVIDGAIDTFQQLLGGQLQGLRSQYQTTTGEDNFNDFLLPETRTALGIPDEPAQPAAEPGGAPASGGAPAGGSHALPADAVAKYKSATPEQKAKAKAKWESQGFDVSGLS
jgi:hypothetical protein